uniref:ShKT domain-containing protein n=1 Tax=Macrostomum lignano TaxID=282301 RepID=A0A1I8GXX3_9PLAT
MPDDYAGRSSELCYSGLMRYGLYEDSGWSTCAVQNLERYLFIKDNTCLHRSETPSLSESPSPPPLPLNTAWRAPAWQSSTANDDEFVWGAWKATDGHIFGVPHENTVGKTENLLGHLGSCSQTKVEFKPWLVIELDSQLDTSNSSEELQVQVYGREECCDQPARPFSHAGQTCFDKARYCDEWKMAGDCDTAHRADCRRTCGLCGPAARLKRRQPQPSPAKRQPCKDSHRYCRFFAANGLCEEKWPHCPLACDRCNSENPAASQIYLAPPKVRAPVAESTDTVTITTTTNTVAMATEAMATASSTVVESATDKQQHVECTDKDSDCQHWAGALYCQFPHIADKHCRKSCGTCS